MSRPTAVREVSTTSVVAPETVTVSLSCPVASGMSKSARCPTVIVTEGMLAFEKFAACTVTS